MSSSADPNRRDWRTLVLIPAAVTVFVLIAAALTGELRSRFAAALISFPVIVGIFYSIEFGRRWLHRRIYRRFEGMPGLTPSPVISRSRALLPFWIMAPCLWLVVFGTMAVTTYVLGIFVLGLILGAAIATACVGSLAIAYWSNANAARPRDS
jgi:hypothetical protein